MQNRAISCTAFCLTLTIAWALAAGIELTIWLTDTPFPPMPIMSFIHVALATLTLAYAITRAANTVEAKVASARSNFELGRDVGAAMGAGRPGLRAVE